MNALFKPIYDECNNKIIKLEKQKIKIRENTERKCVTAAVLVILKNPEYKEHFNITPVTYAINIFGFDFNPNVSTHVWSAYISKCPYYIGHPKFEETVTFPDLLREQALYSDITSIKYIKDPTIRQLKIVADLAPELLGSYSINQEVQDHILNTNPINIRYISTPTVKTAVQLLKISPCYITYLPAVTKNHQEVLATFISQHYCIFRNIQALKAFKTTECLEISDKIFTLLTRLEKR